MIKYYGFTYEGKGSNYRLEKETCFDTPYDALKNANDKWNSNPDFQIARLLVIISLDTSQDNLSLLKYAFFQFTNSESCKKFIINQNKIIWSTNEHQIWNGDAKMM